MFFSEEKNQKTFAFPQLPPWLASRKKRIVDDPFNLDRFVTAQSGIYPRVVAELQSGQKRSHWMWFIFPQIEGLGRSDMARHFAISSIREAGAYLRHEILGERLTVCTRLVNQLQGRSVHEIFGSPDDLKFHSSITLFAQANPGITVFQEALRRHFGGVPDRRTLELLLTRGGR